MLLLLAETYEQGRYYAKRLGVRPQAVVTRLDQVRGLAPEIVIKVGTFGAFRGSHTAYREGIEMERYLISKGTKVVQGPTR